MKTWMAALVAATFGATAMPAAADIVNGSFTAGLSGWAAAGDASVAVDAAGPALWLTTAAEGGSDDDGVPFNRTGTAQVAVAAADGLAAFAGVAATAFDAAPGSGEAYEGSAVRQSFVAAAGDTLTFRWDLRSNDPLGDRAFVVVDGQAWLLAASDQALPGSGAPYAASTGPATFSWTFAGGGAHSLGFAVVDIGDYSVSSALVVSEVALTPVPEAPALVSMLAGLAALAGRRRARSESVSTPADAR